MHIIKDILMYMDRTFVKRCRKTPIYDLGLRIFKRTVIRGQGQQQQQQQQQRYHQQHHHQQRNIVEMQVNPNNTNDAPSHQGGVGPRVRQLLLSAVRKERNGEVIDAALVANTLRMLVDLGVGSNSVYAQEFEQPFLQATEAYYRAESRAFIASNTCPECVFFPFLSFTFLSFPFLSFPFLSFPFLLLCSCFA